MNPLLKKHISSLLSCCLGMLLASPFALAGKSKNSNPIVATYLQSSPMTKLKSSDLPGLAKLPKKVDKAKLLTRLNQIQSERQRKLVLRKNNKVWMFMLNKKRKKEFRLAVGKWKQTGNKMTFTFQWKNKSKKQKKQLWSCNKAGNRLSCSWTNMAGKKRQVSFTKS